MSKRKAFLIHLAASLFVFSILLMLIIYIWYPAPYFDTDYRMKWIVMIAFVDVVIGPGLTLLVYKADKPSVRFDMSIIVLLQLTALSWGVWNAWDAHPKLNVFFDGQVYCMDRKEIKAAGVNTDFVHESMSNKIMLVLPYPDTQEKRKEYMASYDKKVPLVFTLGHLFEVASQDSIAVLSENQDNIMPVLEANTEYMEQWKKFMAGYEVVNADWRYYKFNCYEDNKVIVLDRKNNKVEAVLEMTLPNFWN
ncbi:MAG: hypothetical protein OEY29_00370 [Gammaproteobacteria bacterium]|nr:hypothetical protein [Gammaproteobacteria bacterium]